MDLRTLIGMSQDLFAAWIGVERSLLAKYEKGERSLSRSKLAFQKSIELDISWYNFSENWSADKAEVLELPPEEVKRREKVVKELRWAVYYNTQKLKKLEKSRIDYAKVRAFLKALQPTETTLGAEYAILKHLNTLQTRELQALRTRQDFEINIRKAQAEMDYLKTQSDWLPFLAEAPPHYIPSEIPQSLPPGSGMQE